MLETSLAVETSRQKSFLGGSHPREPDKDDYITIDYSRDDDSLDNIYMKFNNYFSKHSFEAEGEEGEEGEEEEGEEGEEGEGDGKSVTVWSVDDLNVDFTLQRLFRQDSL